MNEPQAHRIRRRRSREEADRLVLEYEQSGLTRRIFCRQHGLSLATLDSYRRQSACGPGQASDDGASLHIELAGGRRIGVTAGFDAATLTRLIAVLEQA